MHQAFNSRLSLAEPREAVFDQTVVANYRGRRMSLVDALINSIKTGKPISFASQGETITLLVGMLDFRSEPWCKRTPLFFGYQLHYPIMTEIHREEDVKAIWLGELTQSKSQVILRRIYPKTIPAQTRFIGYVQTAYEWRIGFVDAVLEPDDLPFFEATAAAAKAASAIRLMTSRLVFGLGETRLPFHPWYLPVQLERVFPWMMSSAIWNLSHGASEFDRRINHAGFAILREKQNDGRIMVCARPAAGYFFTSTSRGGGFRQDSDLIHTFEEETAGGLIPAPVAD